MTYIEVYSPPLHAVAVSCLLYIQAVKHCYYLYLAQEKSLRCRQRFIVWVYWEVAVYPYNRITASLNISLIDPQVFVVRASPFISCIFQSPALAPSLSCKVHRAKCSKAEIIDKDRRACCGSVCIPRCILPFITHQISI